MYIYPYKYIARFGTAIEARRILAKDWILERCRPTAYGMKEWFQCSVCRNCPKKCYILNDNLSGVDEVTVMENTAEHTHEQVVEPDKRGINSYKPWHHQACSIKLFNSS